MDKYWNSIVHKDSIIMYAKYTIALINNGISTLISILTNISLIGIETLEEKYDY